MNARIAMKRGVTFVGLAGAILASIPFVQSLRPSEQAKALLPRIRAAELGRAYTEEWRGQKVFIYRMSDAALYVFAIPYENDSYRMPDLHWSRAIIPCADFRTPIGASGRVDPNGEFRCNDPRLNEWWRRELRWSIAGKRLGQFVDDLPVPKYQVVDDYVVLGAS